MRRVLPAVALVTTLAACQPAPPKVDVAAEEQAIRAQVAALNTAVQAYDTAGIGAVYAPDAVLLPPNQGRMVGTDLIEGMFGGMEALKAQMTLTPTAIMVAASGDLAVEEGTWTWTMPNADGSTFNDNGKYLVAWKKTGGKWLIQADTWNSDNAPPASGASAAK
jgi:uncharacterized protein (TIGR02246 family)